MRLLAGVSYLGRESLRIVLPSPCVVCGEDLPWGGRRGSCCEACWDALPAIRGLACRRCGVPWPGAPGALETFLCLDCAGRRRDPIERIVSWGVYAGGLERLLHAFKFGRHDFLEEPLSRLLVEAWIGRAPGGVDLVTAVPMHRRKLARRGYNQAELLGRRFARGASLGWDGGLLRKIAETPPQAGLRRGERRANVRRAFGARCRLKGERVLLIDDVCTTGETLRACARALRRAGSGAVLALTVARAVT